MRNMKKWILLWLAALLLQGCALLPEEDTVRTAPVLRQQESKAYTTVQVMRGDLVQTAKVYCRYVPVQSASLSFSLGDEPIERVLVQPGALVEEGQLLAQLQLGDLEQRLEETQREIAMLEVRCAYLEKQRDLALRRHELTTARLKPQAREEALAELQQQHALAQQEVTDALELAQLTLESLEAEVALRQIRAPFAGVVTRVADMEVGDLSSLNASVMTLNDTAASLFLVSTEHWEMFRPGETYEITVGGRVYRAALADEEALGLAANEKVPGKKADVYLEVIENGYALEPGGVGTLILETCRRDDALYLPSEVLSASEGQAIVYYLREDGMKAIKPVETGATIGEYTEILSGLAEGDYVIADEERAY